MSALAELYSPTADHSLAFAYAEWQQSQRLLEALRAVDSDLSETPVILENALMGRALTLDAPTPSSLLDALTRADLEGAGAGQRTEAIWEALRSVRESEVARADEPVLRLEANHLWAGDFSLERVAPVDRLLRFASERYDEPTALRYLASCALTYAAVYAKTRHIGPPQSVYDDFHRWGVRNEGFASPFNARLLGKQDAGFFSLFPHVDHVFGSRGSFYRTDLASHEGAWSVDPPFIPETLSRAERKIADWMAAGAAAPVIWIGPSSYRVSLPVREHVRLRAGVHSYEALDGGLHLLPVDVSILLIGELPGFDAKAIVSGYTR